MIENYVVFKDKHDRYTTLLTNSEKRSLRIELSNGDMHHVNCNKIRLAEKIRVYPITLNFSSTVILNEKIYLSHKI